MQKHLDEEGITKNFEIDFALEYTLSAMIGVLTYWFRLDAPPPSNKLFELMSELIHNGLRRIFTAGIGVGHKGLKAKHPA